MRISVGICFVVFPLLSAPWALLRGTLRTRGLTLAVHAAGYCDGRDWGYWGIGEIIEICNLILKKVHSHTSREQIALWYGTEKKQFGPARKPASRDAGNLLIPRYSRLSVVPSPAFRLILT
jgi:hypothetical protein